MAKRKPNLLLLGIDSLRRDRMSCYGFDRLTTPHIDQFADEGVLFEECFSPHIPTTPAYSGMMTGLDCFGTSVVALRHQGGLPEEVTTLAEILGQQGYDTTCLGFTGNPAARGFKQYLNYAGWGNWEQRPARKAELLNDVAIPELERMAAGDDPWFLFLRHMDPHSPYLPPSPFDTMFYSDDPCDPNKDTLAPMWDFKPFRDYFGTWMMPGVKDHEWVNAQYDGALAYMDASIARIFQRLEELNLLEDTIVVINGDHGETLEEHEHWYDHHGMYEPNLVVPLIVRWDATLPAGMRVPGMCLHQDLVPSLMDWMEIEPEIEFDGTSLENMLTGAVPCNYGEFYITECTWMRKHGWRTDEWKLIRALEPDFHFRPEVELYNLKTDPEELVDLAEEEPEIVELLTNRMNAWIAKREQETGVENPMFTTLYWSGKKDGPFETSQEAYDTLYIGDPVQAARIQAGKKDE